MTPDDPQVAKPAPEPAAAPAPDPPTLTKAAGTDAGGDTATARRDRPLWRAGDDTKVLAGVAEGLGRYTNRDPALFRAGFVALTFVLGAGLVLYLAAVLTMPAAPGRASMLAAALRTRGRMRSILGLAWVTLGMLVLATGAVPLTAMLVWFGVIVLRKLPEAGATGPPAAVAGRAPLPA